MFASSESLGERILMAARMAVDLHLAELHRGSPKEGQRHTPGGAGMTTGGAGVTGIGGADPAMAGLGRDAVTALVKCVTRLRKEARARALAVGEEP